MIHNMNLKSIYFDKIKSGEKIYEIRLNDEKRQQISVGDIVIFTNDENESDKIQTIVEALIYFKSFDEMIEKLPSQKIGFENSDNKTIKAVYRSFYSQEKETKFGIVAIKIKLNHQNKK